MRTLALLLLILCPTLAWSQKIGSTTITTNAPSGGPCPVTVGTLTLSPVVTRASGISPLFVWFDPTNGGQGATGNTGSSDTALTGNTTIWQDVTFSWNYGDTGASGTGTWAYGSNPGHNIKNTSTGLIGGHLYIVTPGSGDKTYSITATATDGTNTASCTLGVTAYDPNGANGFPGTATTCQAATSTPVAGSGGCPTGAAVLQSVTVASTAAGHRTLYHCGDTFSGGSGNVAGTKWSIGAYGSPDCSNTQTSRPILQTGYVGSTAAFTDGRIIDLDFESTANTHAVYLPNITASGISNGPITVYNIASNNNSDTMQAAQTTQTAVVGSTMFAEVNVGVYFNYAENNCTNGSAVLNCGGTPSYLNVNYQAAIGNQFNGNDPPVTPGNETLRNSACRMCIYSNNNLQNAAAGNGAVLKLHAGNTYNSNNVWIGAYTELVEISDNFFSGTSGANLVETCSQSATREEHLRNIVVERNIFQGADVGGGRGLLACVDNLAVRDNVFSGLAFTGSGGTAVQMEQRSTAGGPPQYNEMYNNTCYSGGNYICIGFSHSDTATAINSWAMNNLVYLINTVSTNNGTGNTISNNTTSTSANPSFTNGSGGFTLISDYKPTANYSGAATTNPAVSGLQFPVFYDALNVVWPPSWSLGAVHP
jgi:hypothetical protein